jgi:tetratricopeptide (TPR) repeat protein
MKRVDEIEGLARSDARGFYAAAVRILDDARALATSDAQRSRADSLISRMRASLYAPVLPDESSRLEDARTIRTYVDEVFAQHKRRARSTVATVVVLMSAAAAQPMEAQQTQQTSFQAGISSYLKADYTEAAHKLSEYVRQHPSDATGWYDLGTAFYRSNDPGRAVWAWLHALELEPRSSDVAHNLTMLNARRAAAQVEHWFPISTAELAWLAALCWWLAIAVVITHLYVRRKGTLIAAMSLGTAAALAIIMIAARWVGPDAVVPAGHGASMYAAPTTRTDVKDHLEVGDAAEIIRRDGDWILVRTSAYTEGWVRKSDVLAL